MRIRMTLSQIRTDSDEESDRSDNFKKSNLAMADVYSFGLTCAHIVGGKLLYSGLSLTQLRQQRSGGFRPELPSACPEFLKYVIHSSLEREPSSRLTFTSICIKLMDALHHNATFAVEAKNLFVPRKGKEVLQSTWLEPSRELSVSSSESMSHESMSHERHSYEAATKKRHTPNSHSPCSVEASTSNVIVAPLARPVWKDMNSLDLSICAMTRLCRPDNIMPMVDDDMSVGYDYITPMAAGKSNMPIEIFNHMPLRSYDHMPLWSLGSAPPDLCQGRELVPNVDMDFPLNPQPPYNGGLSITLKDFQEMERNMFNVSISDNSVFHEDLLDNYDSSDEEDGNHFEYEEVEEVANATHHPTLST